MTDAKKAREQAERYLRECQEYSSEFERDKLISNWEKKERDSDALVSDFSKRAGNLKGKRILELGFGSGLHVPAFVRAGAEVYGLEVNNVLLEIAKENMRSRHILADLRLYDGIQMPYKDDYFDYIFATSVLEHVSDLRVVLRESDRILKTGGRFYISYPNRLAPRETHTGYYFVQYLPRSLAERVLRQFGSNAVEELNMHFLSFWTLKRAIRRTRLRIIFETGAKSSLRGILKRSLAALGIHHSAILKTVMVVLEKHD